MSTNNPMASPSRDHPLPWVMTALLVLALAGAGVMAYLWRAAVAENRRLAEFERNAEIAKTDAERQRALALEALAGVEKARADAEGARKKVAQVEYARTIALAQQAWNDQDNARARELLEGIPAEPRGWEWFYRDRAPGAAPAKK